MEFFSNEMKDTISLGKKLGGILKSGDIICLLGDLGTGKTHFVKGIAEGLDIVDNITSPTFSIVNEYHSGRLNLYHFDVYRVNDPDEIEAIGFDEYIFSDAVSIIEWSNYIEELIPEEHIEINIEKDISQGINFRKISINYCGDRYDYIKELIKK
ncbi:tRNA (adenosine(37)-N6)-threonylcarbamoyltransferase complex ATPase subunit type 1 TsaE [Clostridium tyrobutyricum]|uniref:tRNA (adenosine(37)-N6)-threonylcarbamoyltransferase complex ATPase subunit type 1 TsaE n=1 Tax=Clostridium tyrobutyricum TaxID=1519 RepID=UPI001C38C180|nr:tRNA (adenosine(37)-N6)-threonylcarbamoyltransferase complex ATPase subunit type 1 TsaE [Clostridium tyrobutyricum]MBV4419996.1 tRNA (adenosine(37)-N6)-threonylcarbamoyltransferase complex ATPase subunit type 1 TsaE [Clostridium tyrobutyricum]